MSDVHNLIAIQVKGERPNVKPKYTKCRSFKNVDVQNFLIDLEDQTWDTISEDHQNININVNTAYETSTTSLYKLQTSMHLSRKEKYYLNKFLI